MQGREGWLVRRQQPAAAGRRRSEGLAGVRHSGASGSTAGRACCACRLQVRRKVLCRREVMLSAIVVQQAHRGNVQLVPAGKP
jgi:hypothetical protein